MAKKFKPIEGEWCLHRNPLRYHNNDWHATIYEKKKYAERSQSGIFKPIDRFSGQVQLTKIKEFITKNRSNADLKEKIETHIKKHDVLKAFLEMTYGVV